MIDRTQSLDTAEIKKLAKTQQDQRVGRSLTQLALARLKRDRLTLIAIGIIIILSLLSLGAGLITNVILHVDPNRTNPNNTFQPIGSENHILGTDELGRDQLARLLHAGRVSLGIGFSSAILSLAIGLTLGVITGYYGGTVDDIINWIITTLNSIPALFLLLIVAAVLSPGPTTLVIVLAFLSWTGTTRLVRGETFSIREREYILSARAIGASPWHIMFNHIVPNVLSVTIVTLAISIGNLILVESALSFLGLGVQPPTATWGNMLTRAQSFFNTGPHLVFFPGIMIVVTVLCLYVIGDGLRDAFDPTLKD
ncbi:MAG: ABC transporter permease [Chloroflexi bacterium]|nr:MAG: peptide ABC transporter permease [Phototrophicales bacterium]RMF78661.1 MAG: ABC transporter permease [Chloroflexota bacterium]